MASDRQEKPQKRIVVEGDGPYRVEGGISLVRKTQVVSEYGEPLTWKKEETLETTELYSLCRCGHSREKPFCDGSHHEIDFDGTEKADTRPSAERRHELPGGTNIVVRRDFPLCMDSGFCGTRKTYIDAMLWDTQDTQIRSEVMAMVERCPSGSYTYAVKKEDPDIEPDLPQQIAITTEITSDGPIAGPLWATGNIPVERADGKPFETRNRVTLCSCGHSRMKPLCDGTHRHEAENK